MQQAVKKVAILGAGNIGSAIARLLSQEPDYQVTVFDAEADNLTELQTLDAVAVKHYAITDVDSLVTVLKPFQVVLSACAFSLNLSIAEAALKAGISYFDLTEDVATTEGIRALAKGAREGQVFMPQSGLAPGFIGILAAAVAGRFDQLNSLKMRVGALPQYPSNRLRYNLTWSTEGLINEYCNPCEAIEGGELVKLQPLEGLETLELDGVEYEAFNTSGGLGTLCESLHGQVQELNYKTMRYPGHHFLMQFLTQELGLGGTKKRQLFSELIEDAVPTTTQDIVILAVVAKGMRNGKLEQMTEVRKIKHSEVAGERWTAIQLATSAGVCAVIDLYFEGKLPAQGFVKQEQVNLDGFIANRFGRLFAA